MPDQDDVETQIQRVTRVLSAERPDGLPVDVVERKVRECLAARDGARIKDFVSLLAERSACDGLRHLRQPAPAGAAHALGPRHALNDVAA